ncbi:MAG: polysaccharide deacetylase family protein [Candidatus Rokubacteria bacterium]|nr:polysaccharide deacetylase family protein [Candidatus Rokubacteria bacterium]
MRSLHPPILAACALLFAPTPSAAQRPANELGRIMILEYHKIDHPEGRWSRTPANFRRDLERLWEKGYRLVALNDLLDGRIDVPAGATPVVLTFDDSSPGQFRYIEKTGTVEIDPESAVGILERFAREHPDFGLKATFYVLPGADPPNRLFNQPAHAGRKLRYLVSRGFEIGNHTLWHADLARYGEETVRRQLATAQEWIQRHLPGYRPRTLALPMGNYPREIGWAVRGSVNGLSYEHHAILRVSGGAAPSPFSGGFDPLRLPRMQALESEISYWLGYFDRNLSERFVSDGDPLTVTVPKGQREAVRNALPPSLRIVERD